MSDEQGRDARFGERLVEGYREAAGTLSSLPYALIQVLRNSEREDIIEMFGSMLRYDAIQRMRTDEPEGLGAVLLRELRSATTPYLFDVLIALAEQQRQRQASRGAAASKPAEDTDTPFGAQLLDALKLMTGSVGNFDYATIQRLKTADREEVIRIFGSKLSYAAKQQLRTLRAEDIAANIVRERQAAAAAVMATTAVWPWFVI